MTLLSGHLWSVLIIFTCLHSKGNIRAMSSVVAMGSNIICNRIPGLAPKQKLICRSSPDAIVAVGNGAKMGIVECQEQFKSSRWNCSAIGDSNVFGHVIIVGSREAAFTYAISSSGITYAITQACSRGNISSCGCDPSTVPTKGISPSGWKWGGCSADIQYGMRFARRFVDAREMEGDLRSLMNLHNNKAGRQAVKRNMHTECKCHGVSGSCTMKTCWRTLPSFRQIGNYIMSRYMKAKSVFPIKGKGKRSTKVVGLSLRMKRKAPKKPRKRDLVYIQPSPNYCERNLSKGSLGTVGRRCNRTSAGQESCNLLCCGRGYNTHQYNRRWQCRCKFHWCCHVECDTCAQRTEIYTCK